MSAEQQASQRGHELHSSVVTAKGEYRLLAVFGRKKDTPRAVPHRVKLSVAAHYDGDKFETPKKTTADAAPSPSMSRFSPAANELLSKRVGAIMKGAGVAESSDDDDQRVHSRRTDSMVGLLEPADDDQVDGPSFDSSVHKYYIIYNTDRTMLMCELLRPSKAPRAVRKFRVNPTCHDIRGSITVPEQRIDVLVGLESGAIAWHNAANNQEPSRYFNQDGVIDDTRVTTIRWVSRTTFVAGHKSGQMYIYDTEKLEEKKISKNSKRGDFPDSRLRYRRSRRYNPVRTAWMCKGPVNDTAISPDKTLMAVACRDGYIRVLNIQTGGHIVSFKSFYGAFLCVAWSPDGEFILSGGEDDAVCLWSLTERAICARGEGHTSWVSGVAFDAFTASNDVGGSLSFASVGADCKICMWSFSYDTIARPQEVVLDVNALELLDENSVQTKVVVYKREDAPIIGPDATDTIHHEPVTSIEFLPFGMLTTCSGGETRLWVRPGLHDSLDFIESDDDDSAIANSLCGTPHLSSSGNSCERGAPHVPPLARMAMENPTSSMPPSLVASKSTEGDGSDQEGELDTGGAPKQLLVQDEVPT